MRSQGSVGIVNDGYITRIPQGEFYGGGGGLAYTHFAYRPDVAAVSSVLSAIGGPPVVNLLLTGHSHFDHSFDTATWSSMTGAAIIDRAPPVTGPVAQNIPAEKCTQVVGGERMTLAPGVTMRAIRWNHKGDPVSNPEQHNPIELNAVPVQDPVLGGFDAGVAEDFPNGGGNRAFLFTVDGPQGRFSWFFQNSASTYDLRTPIVVDGTNYGAPLDNLQYLARSGVKLVRPGQSMDKWRLSITGVVPVSNTTVKRALGFSDVQTFPLKH